MAIDERDVFLQVPLKRLAKFRSGGAIDNQRISDEGKFPVYGGNGIRGYTSESNIHGHNLLVGRQGALSGNVHRVIGPIWASEHALIASLSTLINFDFAYYLLQNMNLNQYSQAAAQPGISASVIQAVTTHIPKEISEQRAIAEFLDTKTAEIDELVEKLQREVQLLERYRRELIAHTVTRGLNPDVPMRDSGIDWIGKIPSHWKTASISTITDENKVKNSDLSEKNLLSLSYGKIIRKDIDLAFGLLPASFDAYQVLEKDYIVLRMTDLQNDKRSLRSAIAKEKGIITGAYIGLKTRNSINPDYLAWLLRFYDLAKVFYSLGGGVRQSANYKEIGKTAALVPLIKEQEQIAIFLETKTTEIDSTISNITKQIELLAKYRKQVINDAVTGKVRVGEAA